jgi:hypothetical protein
MHERSDSPPRATKVNKTSGRNFRKADEAGPAIFGLRNHLLRIAHKEAAAARGNAARNRELMIVGRRPASSFRSINVLTTSRRARSKRQRTHEKGAHAQGIPEVGWIQN